jgi:tight adherence protein C
MMGPWLLPAVFMTTFLLFLVLRLPAGDQSVKARLAALGARPGASTALADPLGASFEERIIAPLLRGFQERVRQLTPAHRILQIRALIHQSGQQTDPARFVLGQMLAAGLLGLVMLVPAMLMVAQGQLQALLLPLVGVVLGWRLPVFSLARKTKGYQQALTKALPDVMDVLSVSVEAGLGFDGAMQKVSEKFQGPIASAFGAYLAAVRFGTPRADALRALADRSGIQDLQTFAAAVIQADQLGVSIGRVLKGQSDSMRQSRRQRAEERAMQLPLKLLFPLIFFIFPTLFLVVLGPVAITLIQMFSGGTLVN